ncbi:MAG: SpaH/EbpB family LPXTG-anchored major pilin [Oscillospiraceae bacterium]|nr:SpaH/EbpB family LPXTG-anchored major pilin [Oscillospiraceae bacterium]
MKTKTMKKILAASVAAFMMCAAVPMNVGPKVSAYTITISSYNGESAGTHTYTAYQIFKGDVSGSTLSNVQWGDGVNTSGLLDAIKAIDINSSKPFENCSTAADVAVVLSGNADDSEIAVKFAKVVSGYVIGGTDSTGNVINVGNNPGYYLIKDKNTVTNSAQTRYILKVTDSDVTINPKMDYPTVDKKIGPELNSTTVANTASIGDTIPYVIKSTIPDMTGYSTYDYKITDTMSTGLTYDDATGVTVAIDMNDDGAISEDEKLAKDTNYNLSTTNNIIEINFLNFINQQTYKGKNIYVTYSAKLNENASLSTTGSSANTNTVKLEYSNNPNNSSDKGTTPDKTVVTYTAQLKINKTDGNNPLAGAGFTVYNSTGDTVVLNELVTPANGIITFKGLGAGTYVIKETTVPAGYNKAADITFTISATPADSYCTWSTSDSTFTLDDTLNDEGGFTGKIVNNKGATLPGTGGIGTTIFYVSGGALVVGAAVVLITRKRMSLKEDKK